MNEYELRKLAKSSLVLRMRPKDTRWLLRIAGIVVNMDGKRFAEKKDWNGFSEHLRRTLRFRIRGRYGNPIVVWFLLNVILPIVIRLVIKWWLNRIKSKA